MDEIQTAALTTMRVMDQAYDLGRSKVVFDEVLVVSLSGNVLNLDWHESKRTRDEIWASFRKDSAQIRLEIVKDELLPGDFHFDNHAGGSIFDAFILISMDSDSRSYLVFNNITLSMQEVKCRGNWLAAQGHFAALARKFEVNNTDDV